MHLGVVLGLRMSEGQQVTFQTWWPDISSAHPPALVDSPGGSRGTCGHRVDGFLQRVLGYQSIQGRVISLSLRTRPLGPPSCAWALQCLGFAVPTGQQCDGERSRLGLCELMSPGPHETRRVRLHLLEFCPWLVALTGSTASLPAPSLQRIKAPNHGPCFI